MKMYETIHLLKRMKVQTCQDENECRIECDVCEQRQVVERVLLGPRPDANRQDAQTQKLKDFNLLKWILFQKTKTYHISMKTCWVE